MHIVDTLIFIFYRLIQAGHQNMIDSLINNILSIQNPETKDQTPLLIECANDVTKLVRQISIRKESPSSQIYVASIFDEQNFSEIKLADLNDLDHTIRQALFKMGRQAFRESFVQHQAYMFTETADLIATFSTLKLRSRQELINHIREYGSAIGKIKETLAKEALVATEHKTSAQLAGTIDAKSVAPGPRPPTPTLEPGTATPEPVLPEPLTPGPHQRLPTAGVTLFQPATTSSSSASGSDADEDSYVGQCINQ